MQACGPGATCTGRLAGSTRCAPTCFDGRDCDPALICETSYDGQKFCTGKPDLIFARATGEGPVAPTGCSAAPGGLSLALLLGALRARRRQNR